MSKKQVFQPGDRVKDYLGTPAIVVEMTRIEPEESHRDNKVLVDFISPNGKLKRAMTDYYAAVFELDPEPPVA